MRIDSWTGNDARPPNLDELFRRRRWSLGDWLKAAVAWLVVGAAVLLAAQKWVFPRLPGAPVPQRVPALSGPKDVLAVDRPVVPRPVVRPADAVAVPGGGRALLPDTTPTTRIVYVCTVNGRREMGDQPTCARPEIQKVAVAPVSADPVARARARTQAVSASSYVSARSQVPEPVALPPQSAGHIAAGGGLHRAPADAPSTGTMGTTCETIARALDQVQAVQRQPLTAYEQDYWSTRRRDLHSQAFFMHCHL